MRSRRSRDVGLADHADKGFTLIELTVVLVIMPIIIGAIALGLVAVFHLQTSTTQRLSGSVDLQKVSAQYVKDVENVETIYLGPTPQQCGTVGVQLLGLAWSGGSTMVSYVRVPMTNNSSNYALERLYCTQGNFSVPASVNVLSSDFYETTSSFTQYPPSVCLGSISTRNCVTTSNSYNAHNVAAVTLTLYVPMSSSPYTLVASPRGGSAGIPANGNGTFSLTTPLTLLGSDCPNNSVLSVYNGASLTIQSGTGSSATPGVLGIANCPASSIDVYNQGSINASSILTGTTDTSGINTSQKNPGTIPTTVNSAPSLCDPFQAEPNNANCQNPLYPISPPNYSTTCTGSSCGICSGTKSANIYIYTCSAGVYTVIDSKSNIAGNLPSATLPNLNNGDKISFTGGPSSPTTVIVPPFYVPNGSAANFAQGIYVFAASSGNAFNTGTNGVGISGTNVMFYAPTGNITFQNNATVNLLGMSPAQSTTYYGITLWLNGVATSPSSATGVLYLGNNSSQTNGYGGIYVPYGYLVSNQVGNLNTTFVVVGSAVFYQNTTVVITAP